MGYQCSDLLPDTDVYNIGLGLVSHTAKQYIVQINVPHAAEKRYLHINNLHLALQRDPDLASLPRSNLGLVLQSLFICILDAISFPTLKHWGKQPFSTFSFNMLSSYVVLGYKGAYMIQKIPAVASYHLFA